MIKSTPLGLALPTSVSDSPSHSRSDMNPRFFRTFFLSFCAIAATIFAAFPATAQTPSSTTKRLLGYYPEWSKTQTPPYTASQIPYAKLTHISHAFLLLAPKTD